jgi:hypothetical protein
MRYYEEAPGALLVAHTGLDARKKKSESLPRVSITITRGNSRVLDCVLLPDWLPLAACLEPHCSQHHNPIWSLAQRTTHALRPPLGT